MKNILLVEDDYDVRSAIVQLLAPQPFEIRAAANGLDALTYLSTRPRIDLIILDLMMPTFSGWELLAEIRAQTHYRKTPVLVMSALSPAPQGAEIQGYIQKPFNPDVFLELVQKLSSGQPLKPTE